MKVTAILPDDLVHDVRELAQGSTLTESLITALRDWVALRKVRRLNRELAAAPLQFTDGFSAEQARELTRRT